MQSIKMLASSYLVPVVAVAAEAATALSNTWSPLINLGAIGCVLAWFLIRAEPRMSRIERAIDRSSRAVLIAALAMSEASPGVRDQAKELIREIDALNKGEV